MRPDVLFLVRADFPNTGGESVIGASSLDLRVPLSASGQIVSTPDRSSVQDLAKVVIQVGEVL